MGLLRLELELTEAEAQAFEQALRQIHRQRFQDEFWKPRYSSIPHPMRPASILAQCPDLAANTKLLGALKRLKDHTHSPGAFDG
ncbi:hypothetical protein [Pseudomonas jilinensis]|uniref:Uncharacterized protein n=1 Tax=Pseudomonas jilinensis TaxID=2078689 RepID=A0A396RYK4_9PSED|nr:hypothetical protein [Pseudomonas jilinensis]RHW21718.1 hypothetical protein C2846_07135 [Pseudomonas jilinensis]